MAKMFEARFLFLFVCFISLVAQCLGALANSVSSRSNSEKCSFPAEWAGEWFQSRVENNITITATSISEKGECLKEVKKTSGDFGQRMFHVYDREYESFRCLLIFSPHKNLLKYKESSECYEDCENICEQLDNKLYSMFRIKAEPIKCPFAGRYMFTYKDVQNGLESCDTPVSKADVCVGNNRLRLEYKSCSSGSILQTDTLTCYADWSSQDKKYVLAKKEGLDLEESFRCYRYETDANDESKTILTESADATCQELFTGEKPQTNKVLTMTKQQEAKADCPFPSWIAGSDRRNPMVWLDLNSVQDSELSYKFSNDFKHLEVYDEALKAPISSATFHSVHSIISQNRASLVRRTAARRKNRHNRISNNDKCNAHAAEAADEVLIVAAILEGCAEGYRCYAFRKRDDQVIQVRQGDIAADARDACTKFLGAHKSWSTLIVPRAKARKCKLGGKYAIPKRGLPEAFLSGSATTRPSINKCYYDSYEVRIGCDASSDSSSKIMVSKHPEALSKCSEFARMKLKQERSFTCHGSWSSGVSNNEYTSYTSWPTRSPTAAPFLAPSPAYEVENSLEHGLKPGREKVHFSILSNAESGEKFCLFYLQNTRKGEIVMLAESTCPTVADAHGKLMKRSNEAGSSHASAHNASPEWDKVFFNAESSSYSSCSPLQSSAVARLVQLPVFSFSFLLLFFANERYRWT